MRLDHAPQDAVRAAALRGIDRTFRATAVGALLLLAAWLLKDALLLAFAAVLVACGLRGASDRLARATGLGEGWSLLAVVLLLASAVGALVWWRGPQVAEQGVQLADQLAEQGRRLWDQLGRSAWGTQVLQQLERLRRSVVDGLGGYVTGFASSTLGVGGSLLLVGATALFLAASPRVYVDGSLRLLPLRWRPRGREVLQELGSTLRLWFAGQLIDMLVIASLVAAGLLALGVPLAFTLALFAGLLNFVPFIGALAGAVPAVLVALAQSPAQALWVGLLFAAVQALEGNVVAPLVQRRTVSLPPALTIFAQTILGTLFGLLGLILATPVMAAAMTAVRMVYVESVLEGGTDACPPCAVPGQDAGATKKNASPSST